MNRKTRFQTRNVRVQGSLSHEKLLMETYNDITKLPPIEKTIQSYFEQEKPYMTEEELSTPALVQVICLDGELYYPSHIIQELIKSEFVREKTVPCFARYSKQIVSDIFSSFVFNRFPDFSQYTSLQLAEAIGTITYFVNLQKNIVSSIVAVVISHALIFDEKVEEDLVCVLIRMNDVEALQSLSLIFQSSVVETILKFLLQFGKVDVKKLDTNNVLYFGKIAIDNLDFKLFREFAKEAIDRQITSIGIFLWKFWSVYDKAVEEGILDLFILAVQNLKNEDTDLYFMITVEEILQHEDYLPYLQMIIAHIIHILDTRCTNILLPHCLKIIGMFTGTEHSNKIIFSNYWHSLVFKRITGKFEFLSLSLPILVNLLSTIPCCKQQVVTASGKRTTFCELTGKCYLKGTCIVEMLISFLSSAQDPSEILQIFDLLTSTLQHDVLDSTLPSFMLPILLEITKKYAHDEAIVSRGLNLFADILFRTKFVLSEKMISEIKGITTFMLERSPDIVRGIVRIMKYIGTLNIQFLATYGFVQMLSTIVKTYTTTPSVLFIAIDIVSNLYCKNVMCDYMKSEGTPEDISICLKMSLDNYEQMKSVHGFNQFVENCCFILGFASQECTDKETLEQWISAVSEATNNFPNNIKITESTKVLQLIAKSFL
ncbi:hypothetical protein EIN_398150 [Entamoeba invadens IP1]|uniref:Uncharacterized protein n=1 Tax=Entamoeba invadens IP1 TaxID=370355 RepID=A0A0A1UA77_ENTIV|nr:hypothetical protein EIN_398150 [Entamoeba invadens IP1]ELP91885.1 hypothetical protein EIN_398150 [Entamoeba invadens IP1]|eukprot:XP_004258656.1 hypothetical protein EIN_398150 [Entamoeba invadens IP1]